MSADPRTHMPGWDFTPRPKRRGRCPLCRSQTAITIVTQATLRKDGKTSSLKARSVALCNEHALALFSELEPIIDRYRGDESS